MARLPQGCRRKENGTLEKRFTINGKRFSVYGVNVKEIQEKETALRKDIEENGYHENSKITLDQYYTEWIERKANSVKINSIRLYSSIYMKYIKPELGSRIIRKLERRECIALQIKSNTKDISASTVNYIMLVLVMILNDAAADGIISKNPAANIKQIKTETERAADTIHRALTKEEQYLFMKYASDHFYYEFFAFLLSTGMRCGEAAALKWSDIDYQSNVIHVTKTVSYDKNNNPIINSPKSAAGKRDIPMNEGIKEVLKMQRKKTADLPVVNFDGNVFFSMIGTVIRSNSINRIIAGIIEEMRTDGHVINKFTGHAFRDTFATRYIEAGGTPQTLKTILGHSSLAMTMDLYAHVLPDQKQIEMDRIKISI